MIYLLFLLITGSPGSFRRSRPDLENQRREDPGIPAQGREVASVPRVGADPCVRPVACGLSPSPLSLPSRLCPDEASSGVGSFSEGGRPRNSCPGKGSGKCPASRGGPVCPPGSPGSFPLATQFTEPTLSRRSLVRSRKLHAKAGHSHLPPPA